ncbi:MAG: tyrosine--tRNA ligase [Patescibacteria group bacterium]
MTKSQISKTAINSILTRGVEGILVRTHLEKILLSGKKLRVKLGIDPTGPKIHLGRAIVLWKLKEFQDLGHQVVLIIGDFTAQIGDPSDKLDKRPMLTPEQIKANAATYKEQLSKILDITKVEWHYNSEWLATMSLYDSAILADSFSFQQMMARRNFRDRLKNNNDISLREFMYPMLQGYDSVVVRADVEIGGNDQLFNLHAGRKVQEYYKQLPQDILMTQMLEGIDGRKMSTSWGNVVTIVDEPSEMYGKILSIKDELIPKYLLLTTRLSQLEVDKLVKDLKQGANPKIIKQTLAREVVTLYHSKSAAQKAEAEFENVHKQGNLPEDMSAFSIPNGKKNMSATELLVYLKLTPSKSEAQRLIKQGGVKINGVVVKNWQAEVVLKSGLVVQVGSRRFAKLK